MDSRFTAILLGVSLTAAGAVAAPPASLKALYDAHDWFKLRDAVAAAPDAPPLYRGAVAYAFHDLEAAEKSLRRAVASAPRSDEAIEARGLLIYVGQMKGNYRASLAEIRALQSVVSDARSLENGAAFFSALAPLAQQGVSKRHEVTVRASMHDGNLFIPVSISGKSVDCIVDTGANFSLLSEGEARRLGLAIREAPESYGTDAAGTNVPFRLALADRLTAGAFELRNVVFLVSRDDQQPFADLPLGSRAVLGIPVLLGFQALRWHADGRFEIGFAAPRYPPRDANLCFDAADVHVAAQYQGRPVTAFLDTGATKTRLMPAFGKDFPAAIPTAGTETTTVRGVGGSVEANVAVLHNVMLRIGDRDLVLDSTEALLKNLEGRVARFHVWAGLDLFAHASVVTVDFRSMTLDVH